MGVVTIPTLFLLVIACVIGWKIIAHWQTVGRLLCGLMMSVLGLLGFIAAMVLIHHDQMYRYSSPLSDLETGRIIMAVSATVILLLGIYLLVMHFVKTKQD
jgi:small-conductance mechanosensitive channel